MQPLDDWPALLDGGCGNNSAAKAPRVPSSPLCPSGCHLGRRGDCKSPLPAPIDFSGQDGLLHLWPKEEYFDLDKLINAYGNCPPAMLQGAFGLMQPVQNFIEKYGGFV